MKKKSLAINRQIAGDKKNPSIRNALRTELTWTHYRLLIHVENPKARAWYMNEAADQNWSTRVAGETFNSQGAERSL